jgi:hypothetical protein
MTAFLFSFLYIKSMWNNITECVIISQHFAQQGQRNIRIGISCVGIDPTQSLGSSRMARTISTQQHNHSNSHYTECAIPGSQFRYMKQNTLALILPLFWLKKISAFECFSEFFFFAFRSLDHNEQVHVHTYAREAEPRIHLYTFSKQERDS